MAARVRSMVLTKPKTLEPRRYPFEKMHTLSLPLEQAEDAIHMLAGHVKGVNPVHLAIVPGVPRVAV